MKKSLIFISVLAAFLIFACLLAYSKGTQSDIAANVLRLHVIANSNEEYDQNLKLAVRDRIVEETKELFSQCKSPEQTKQTAQENIELFKQIARDEILKQGYIYDADVQIGVFPFPTKVYGDVMLPAGQYDAIRIIIGEGKGENWWCVLFPPLCFINGVKAEIPDEAKEELKKSLTPEEYELITENNTGNMPVQIKFKIVEILAPIFNKH